jgi:asparagine synthase (glutamine-hydrolysing)
MCGICGSVDFERDQTKDHGVRAMAETLVHRGPDYTGVWSGNKVALGHTRLSILDISDAGRQPMSTADGRFTITYNGEVYNFKELRAELESRGVAFHSRTDTEVVLQVFACWGSDGLSRLNGIFAFGIWDSREERLHLVRDRFGVKPLYYHVSGSRLWFGSEIKALLAAGNQSFSVDGQALHEFMHFGVGGLGLRTLFEGVQKLESASILTFGRPGLKVSRYWKIGEVPSSGDDHATAVRRVNGLLDDAVHRQLVSDVPVAVFLSGGIDSSAVTAFAARHYGGPLTTYAVGFDFAGDANELPKAARVARHFGTVHRELYLRGTDLATVVQELVVQHDAPFSDAANIPLFLLCRALRGSVKVVLQGDGGDEVFGGYRRYRLLRRARFFSLLARSAGWVLPLLPISPRTKARLARMVGIWRETDDPTRMALLLAQDGRRPSPTRLLGRQWQRKLRESEPFTRYRCVGQEFRHLDPVQRMLWTDMQILLPDIFLEKVDRATMAHGVEARVPFLDHQLTDYVLGLPANTKMPGGRAKGLLKQSLRGTVPDFVLDAPKMGFGVPYSRWLAGPLAAFARERICEGIAARDGLIDRTAASAVLDEHVAGRGDHGFLLWKYLNLAIWIECYCPRLSV